MKHGARKLGAVVARAAATPPVVARAAVALAAIVTVATMEWPRSGAAAPLAAPATGPAKVAAAAPPPASAAAGGIERFTATVRAFDPRSGTVDLVTGVGMALRVRRVQLPSQMKVKVDGAESPASVLTPGCIVRTECRRTAGTTVAYKVELVQAAPRTARQTAPKGRRP